MFTVMCCYPSRTSRSIGRLILSYRLGESIIFDLVNAFDEIRQKLVKCSTKNILNKKNVDQEKYENMRPTRIKFTTISNCILSSGNTRPYYFAGTLYAGQYVWADGG